MSRMTARYNGTCRKTGVTIVPGDIIDYDRRTRSTVLVMRSNPDGEAPSDYPADPDVSIAASIDPDLTEIARASSFDNAVRDIVLQEVFQYVGNIQEADGLYAALSEE